MSGKKEAAAPPPRSPGRALLSRGAAGAALATGLALTAAAAWLAAERVRDEAGLRIAAHADRMANEIADRVELASYGLRGARAMIVANDGVTREEFRAYVAARELQRDFPGVRSFVFLERVRREDLPAFIAAVRAEGVPQFQVKTSGNAPELLVIRYVEPWNPEIGGLDLGADPPRREVVERAIRSGEWSLSAPIALVRGGQPGWLLCVPVYRGLPAPQTPAERDPRLLGVLYAPIDAPAVFAPLAAPERRAFDFELFDGPPGATPAVFDSRPRRPGQARPLFEEVRSFPMGGRTFSVRVRSTPEMEDALRYEGVAAVAVAGTALSTLLALALMRLTRRRELAEARAEEASSELERVSEGLAVRERLIRLINDNIPARISYWDRDLRCRMVNRMMADGVGLRPDEMIGMRFCDLLPADQHPHALERAQAALRGQGQQFEASAVPGTVAMVYYVPDRVGHKVHGFFVLALDITALKEAQRAAQRASEAKSQFLSNISHEIRTPMNAVLGMLELLRTTPLDQRQGDYAAKAEAAARSLLSLLNDVLDFSRIEAGKMVLDPRPFSFAALLDDLEVILSATLEGKPIALHFEVDPVLPPWLIGDDMRLRQILINLGGNAIKFTHRGQVDVRVRQVERAGGQVTVEISVRDTGIGILPQDQQRIFADFSQAAASTTREFGGSGLGLAICSRLAALMGSSLQVESTPGAGSRFHFRLTLPVSAAPADGAGPRALAQPGQEAAAARPLAGLRLLLAEDNVVNQQVARELLERAGAEVRLAANGREAVLEVAGRGPFDAVLMDIQMPVMDGYQATRDIRQKLSQVGLPIIAMTANAMDTDREHARAAGMDDHVGKPFVTSELIATILRHVGRAQEPRAPAPLEQAPAPAAAASDVVDRAAAMRRLGGDEDLYRRLVPTFCGDLREALRQLPHLSAGMPRADATRLLHSLKSTAGTMGAQRLAEVAALAERQSAEAGKPIDPQLLATLQHEIQRALAAFEAEAQA